MHEVRRKGFPDWFEGQCEIKKGLKDFIYLSKIDVALILYVGTVLSIRQMLAHVALVLPSKDIAISFLRLGDWNTETLRNLSKVSQLLSYTGFEPRQASSEVFDVNHHYSAFRMGILPVAENVYSN